MDENFESPPTQASFHPEDSEPTPHLPNCEPAMPERLGRYRLVSRLGSGGFGVVYKGFDDELCREVAIKVPHRDRLGGSDAEAYLNEGRILASLNHPGIVPVYDVGRTDEGLCYLVSQFVDGTDLSGWLKNERPGPRESVAIVVAVGQALHHAHRCGLVHRDVKPANILRARDGRIVVADFGLALREADFGKGGGYAGTPVYMSPEQARCEGHRVDGRSDIYSLGVVFYELLTRRRPFNAEHIADLLEQIKHQEPRPPRQVDDSVPRELDRICLKCLSKRAVDRYSTALDLVDDLEQWAKGSPAVSSVPREVETETAVMGGLSSKVHSAAKPTARPGPARVTPRGLCSFGPDDAEAYLKLLPGPRTRDDLPESIDFWKQRIESDHEESSFRVALMYGPSGCGKTSLVRAGLLPRLSREVLPVYIEAIAQGTEARLLAALGRACADLEPVGSLTQAIADSRRGRVLPAGRKLLLIIDQFEQWLHGGPAELSTRELISALRQADGLHVQFLLLIRDDFWLGASRVFQELEIPLLDGHNLRLVDLFDQRHARQVLELFGQSYGCLPADSAALGTPQQQFLDEAVHGLSEEGKIVPVRLSVFADMLKQRSWTPRTLTEIGGTDGAGVTFLEETFTARAANPEHRAFEKPARALLAALLPEAGGTIKGRMRSRAELMQAAELPAPRFARLLEILDRELHIITPTEPAEPTGADSYYQLTHDYLVVPLRDWLTQKKRATWRGRAELVLDERTAQWRRERQRRFLPTPIEYVSIILGVPGRRRKPDEKALVRAASHYYGFIGLALLCAACLLGLGGREINNRAQARRLVQQLLAVTPHDAEQLLLSELPAYQRWATPLLREVAADTDAPRERRLRASLALLPVDHQQVEFLQTSLNDGSLDAYPTLRDEIVVPAAFEDERQRDALAQQAQAILGERPGPQASEADLAELGSRQARAVVLLLRLGQFDRALLGCHDLECLGHFAARARVYGVPVKALVDALARAEHPRARYALLLALGNFTEAELPAACHQTTIDKIKETFTSDPNPACHAASGWLLRHWDIELPMAALTVHKVPPPYEGKPGRSWFLLNVDGLRLSFATVPPGYFTIGSPESEKFRVDDEVQHKVEITRPLGVLDREVTVAMWRKFLVDTGRDVNRPAQARSGRDDYPAARLDWVEAVEFCRWLTRKVGLHESEQCYEEIPGGQGLYRFFPERGGFRLPTEAEWEYAARGGSPRTFSFGSEHALLGDFAVFLDNSQRRPAPVGSRRPNPFGIFDMHGNVWEWCSDAKAAYHDGRDVCGPLSGSTRQYRGGSFDNFSRHSRCACRISEQLTARFPYLGFRVVCTLPTTETTAADR